MAEEPRGAKRHRSSSAPEAEETLPDVLGTKRLKPTEGDQAQVTESGHPQTKVKQSIARQAARRKHADIVVEDDEVALDESNDPILRNTTRLATLLRQSKLQKHVKPTQPATKEWFLSDALAGLAPVPGRDVFKKSVTRKAGISCWHIEIAEREIATQKIISSKGNSSIMTIDISYSDVASGDKDKATIHKVTNQAVAILNAWPFPTYHSTVQANRILRELALANVLPSLPPRIPDIKLFANRYSITIDYFDPEGGDRERVLDLTPTDKMMSTVCVPSLPPLRLGAKAEAETVSDGRWPYDGRPPELTDSACSVKSQQIAQDALRYIAIQCQGVVASAERMEFLVAFWRNSLGLDYASPLRPGVYGGRSFFHVYLEQGRRTTRIEFTPALNRDISASDTLRPVIFIQSMNANRVTPALDALVQNYTAEPDIRNAIIESAKTADQVNLDIAEGIPPSSHCDCDDAATSTELHCCESCTDPTICKSRSYDRYGRLVCPACFYRQKLAQQVDERKGETLAEGIARHSFERSFRRECRPRGIDPYLPKQKLIIDTAVKALMKKLPKDLGPTMYVDEYTGRAEEIMHEVPLSRVNPSRRRTTATMLSVDAVFPRMPSTTDPETYYVHAEDNVAITSTTCQYAKYTFLVGVLQVISKYMNVQDPSDTDVEELLDALRSFQLLRLKQKYTKTARTNDKVDPKLHQKDMDQWVSGKPVAGEHGYWEAEALRYVSGRVPSTQSYIWDSETRMRLSKLAKQIADEYGKDLVSAEDGAPWMGIRATMPKDWNWNSWAVLCNERKDRMRVACNKKWETRDTAESLFAEIIYQTYTDDPRYGDGLRLPLVLELHHPLRLSVAHRHHGFGMYSGWPPHPSDLSERKDEENNMLIETWFWNCCKQDMDEIYYGKAIEILKSVKLPQAYYDPQRSPPSDINTDLATLTVIEGEEDFVGEPLDPDDSEAENAAGLEETQPTEDTNKQKEQDVVEGGKPDHSDRGDESAEEEIGEVAALSAEAQAMRQFVVEEHRDKFVANPDILGLLYRLQHCAQMGDRAGYRSTNVGLHERLDAAD
ncbi:hypothetical protein LTR37_002116 [Vermiconidia calcicola]|uniref:Uncharacterized protein n=1 Tax=Vermiconidia calcicola TaxID=1690605 RepID=A0ACC3NTW8_9PEZI|nr:hypothetical protein LTR37_002116 [Vermiconidia calcicola]